MNSEIYKHILTSGREILVDLKDRHFLFEYLINTMKTKHGHTRYINCRDLRTRKYVGLLHRIILNAPKELEVDHENGNGLDCRKSNIRICTVSQNQQNRRLTKIENEVKGLYFRKDRGYWAAYLKIDGKQMYLGGFVKHEDAVKARLEAEEKYHPFRGWGTEVLSREF